MDQHKGKEMPSCNGRSNKSRSSHRSSSKKRSQSLEEFDHKKKSHEPRSDQSSFHKQKAHRSGSLHHSSRKRKSSNSPEELSLKKPSYDAKSPPRLSSSVESTKSCSPVKLHEKKTKKSSNSEPLNEEENKQVTDEKDCMWSSSGKWAIQKGDADRTSDGNSDNQVTSSPEKHEKERFRVFPVSGETQQLVILTHPGKITIKGKVKMRCLCGQVSIFGYHIKSADRSYDIYSPDSHSLVSIETMDGYQGNVEQSPDLLDVIEGSDYLETIVAFLKSLQYPVIMLLEELKRPYLDFISSLKTFKTLFKLESKPLNRYDVKTLETIGAQLYGTKSDVSQLLSTEGFEKINKWIDQNLSNESPPVILVCGGKSVGKSTLTRYLVNTLLNRVEQIAYLECDVGQTEFTPGCCVSVTVVRDPLLGPSFTHLQKPLCCCFLGVLSPVYDPAAYMNVIAFVHKNFLESNIKCPLVVNTMGWSKGIGLALLTDILRLVKPDLVIQINSRNVYKNVPDVTLEFISEQPGWVSPFIAPEDVKQHSLIIIESAVDRLPGRYDLYKPTDHRILNLLSCFGQLLTDVKRDLNAITPYMLPWQQVAVHVCHASVPASQVMYSFNASIVALCTVDESEMVKTDLEGYPKFLRGNPVCPCLGFGVIRGIDPDEKVFYLLSSLSIEEISKVNCLLLGALRVPEMLLLHQKYPVVLYIGQSNSVIGSKSITKRKHFKKRNHPVRW